MARGWSLRCLGLYALFAGGAAVLLGVRILDMHLTRSPLLSGIGFIISGAAGILAAPTLAWFTANRPVRALGALALLAAAAVWALTGHLGYWAHMQSFQHWAPSLMRSAGWS